MSEFSWVELELRQLPSVSFVAIRRNDNATHVQLFAASADVDHLRREARRITQAHIAPPVTIECVTPGRTRVRVVDVRTDASGVEVELAHRERRVAEASSGGDRSDVAAATIAALERLGVSVPFSVSATKTIESDGATATVVVLRDSGDARFGVASGTHETAVVRATLAALNRHVSSLLAG